MANIYFYADVSSSWADPLNWFLDAGHSTPAGTIPVTNDSVYITGSNQPDSPPGGITLTVLDTSALLGNFLNSSCNTGSVNVLTNGLNLSTAAAAEFSGTSAGGTVGVGGVYLGNDSGTTSPLRFWGGTNKGICNTADFNTGDNFAGATVATGTFEGSSTNHGTVSITGTFSDSAKNNSTGFVTDATFNGSSANEGTCSNGTFNGNTINAVGASVSSTGIFNGTSANNGSVGTGTFYQTSQNAGTVSNGTFNDSSTNEGSGNVTTAIFAFTSINKGTIGTGTFSGSATNRSDAVVSTSATFNAGSTNNGPVPTAIFNNTATNSATGNCTTATFNDTSANTVGTVSSATFNGNSSCQSGTITTSLQFNGTSHCSGTTSAADITVYFNEQSYGTGLQGFNQLIVQGTPGRTFTSFTASSGGATTLNCTVAATLNGCVFNWGGNNAGSGLITLKGSNFTDFTFFTNRINMKNGGSFTGCTIGNGYLLPNDAGYTNVNFTNCELTSLKIYEDVNITNATGSPGNVYIMTSSAVPHFITGVTSGSSFRVQGGTGASAGGNGSLGSIRISL